MNPSTNGYYQKASASDAPHLILNVNLSFEDALAHAADLLHCAVETVQDSGDVLSAQQRAVFLGLWLDQNPRCFFRCSLIFAAGTFCKVHSSSWDSSRRPWVPRSCWARCAVRLAAISASAIAR